MSLYTTPARTLPCQTTTSCCTPDVLTDAHKSDSLKIPVQQHAWSLHHTLHAGQALRPAASSASALRRRRLLLLLQLLLLHVVCVRLLAASLEASHGFQLGGRPLPPAASRGRRGSVELQSRKPYADTMRTFADTCKHS